jgi:hypothetical protein
MYPVGSLDRDDAISQLGVVDLQPGSIHEMRRK